MRIPSLLFAGFLCAVHCLAAEPAPRPTIVATSADNGRTIELNPGQTLRVVLESNRTTGFSWTLARVDAAVLTVLGESVYTAAETKPGMVGVGSTETWQIRAAAPGEQRLQFFYRRPFEPNVAPARTFALTVRVQP
jgi:inhibitor of cysteine peptidase